MCFSFYLSCFRFGELLESMTFVNLGKVSAIVFSSTASFSFPLPSLLETFSLTFWSNLNGSLATYLTPSPAILYLVHLLVSNYLALFLISQHTAASRLLKILLPWTGTLFQTCPRLIPLHDSGLCSNVVLSERISLTMFSKLLPRLLLFYSHCALTLYLVYVSS